MTELNHPSLLFRLQLSNALGPEYSSFKGTVLRERAVSVQIDITQQNIVILTPQRGRA